MLRPNTFWPLGWVVETQVQYLRFKLCSKSNGPLLPKDVEKIKMLTVESARKVLIDEECRRNLAKNASQQRLDLRHDLSIRQSLSEFRSAFWWWEAKKIANLNLNLVMEGEISTRVLWKINRIGQMVSRMILWHIGCLICSSWQLIGQSHQSRQTRTVVVGPKGEYQYPGHADFPL